MQTSMFTRRSFLERSLGASAVIAGGAMFSSAGRLLATTHSPSSGQSASGNALRIPSAFTGGMLTAETRKLEIWPGKMTDVLALNGSVPGPTIRVQRGDSFSAHVMNMLTEPLVLHWHGILSPASMDGHPRDAIAPGQSAMIQFPVNQRASTYWYHAHTDMLTGKQVYLGLAGIFIVEDPAESALGLPTGDHDIPLLIADKRPDANKQLPYAPTMTEIMTGFLGTEILANGTPAATLSVDNGLYRLRLINASNARVLKVGLSDNSPVHLIASDAGLLCAPLEVTSFMLPPGARAEILVSFASRVAGSTVTLKSHAFEAPMDGGHGGGGTEMMRGPMQGMEMDILRFSVDRTNALAGTIPTSLVSFTGHDETEAKRTRIFSLDVSHMDKHQINGTTFSIQHVDFAVPKGDLELWEFKDTTGEFHPMHPHGAHFQVLSRGSIPTLLPEDIGWKDTVLVGPNETVKVLVKFDAHDGLFVIHCHNLEHEDDGMMLNFEVGSTAVQPPPVPALEVERMGNMLHLSWPHSSEGHVLQGSATVGHNADWKSLPHTPEMQGDRMVVMVAADGLAQFFRLAKQ